MPAYFSITSIIKKEKLFNGIYADFINTLNGGGAGFIGGLQDFKNESLNDIISWNEKKLQSDFHLGFDEDFSNDFRQVYLDYHDFSQVRFFVLNLEEHDELYFEIIIPEGDLIVKWKNQRCIFDPEKIAYVKSLIYKIWERPYIEVIDTALELSAKDLRIEDLKAGELPIAEPFAVVPGSIALNGMEDYYIKIPMERDGVLYSWKETL